MPGANTSLNETLITNIECDGFWLLTGDSEFFVSFDEYPDFQNATVAQIHDFLSSGDHFHWPALDIDIDLDALKHPDRFPLKYRR
ncbi:MAG: DUF2442 domain-containing protein [Anaerolineales bacterium]|nr:DUF2442 domain-containing protein [Anaerolineales bacterium]